jgi:hypothetical protein
VGRIQGEQQARCGQHDESRLIQAQEIILQIYIWRIWGASVSITAPVLVQMQMHTRPIQCVQYPSTFRLSSLFSFRLCRLQAVTS